MIDNLVDRLETLGRGLGRQFIIYNEAADEITRICAENERLRLELDMSQATIRVPSQKDDVRTIERLREELKDVLDEAARLREALKPFTLETRPEHNVYGYEMVFVKPEQLRAAKAALEKSDE